MLRSEEAAWRQFLADYGPLVYSVVARFVANREARDDVFQDVCCAVQRSLGGLRDPEKLAAWVFRIARRQAIDESRRQRRTPQPATAENAEVTIADGSEGADAELERLEQTALLLDALADLRPRCRVVLHGLYLADPPLSYEELAARHGIPIGSIGPTRARCLEELRRTWLRVSRATVPSTTEARMRARGVADSREERRT